MVGVLFLPARLFADATFFNVKIASIVSGVSNGVVIPVMNALYQVVAKRLNDYELHRHESTFYMSMVIKRFSFQFVNAFSSLLYILFVEQVRAQAPRAPAPRLCWVVWMGRRAAVFCATNTRNVAWLTRATERSQAWVASGLCVHHRPNHHDGEAAWACHLRRLRQQGHRQAMGVGRAVVSMGSVLLEMLLQLPCLLLLPQAQEGSHGPGRAARRRHCRGSAALHGLDRHAHADQHVPPGTTRH